jgi:hypothetical protein
VKPIMLLVMCVMLETIVSVVNDNYEISVLLTSVIVSNNYLTHVVTFYSSCLPH